jgi:SAP domain
MADGAGPIQSSLSESEINNLLAERLRAKMSRSFDDADRLQRQLHDAGVKVHDGRKEWRADGMSFGMDFGNYGNNKPEQPSRTKGPYSPAPESGKVPERDLDEVVQLVAEYDDAKRRRVYDIADDIREQLLTKYNVYLNDRLRQWSVGDKFGGGGDTDGGSPASYRKSELSKPTDDDNDEHIQTQVDLRVEAKRNRDYTTADSIRENLFDKYQVAIDDKLGEWSVGGAFPGIPAKRDKFSYVRVGSGIISDTDLAAVEQLLRDRSQAKADREYDLADQIKETLENQYNIMIRDKTKEWLVMADGYTFVGDKTALDDDETTFAYLERRVQERNEHKKNRNWPAADEIRDELEEKYAVNIDDKAFEWSILSGVGGGRSSRSPGPVANGAVQYTFKEPATVSVSGDEDDEEDDDEEGNSSVSPANGYAELDEDEEDDDEDDDDDVEDEKDWVVEAEGQVNDDDAVPPAERETEKEVTLLPAASQDDLSSLTVVELKAKLKEAGLPVSGRKAELVDRLLSKASLSCKTPYHPRTEQ